MKRIWQLILDVRQQVEQDYESADRELRRFSPTIAHNLCLRRLSRLRHRGVAEERLELETAEMIGLLRVGYQRE